MCNCRTLAKQKDIITCSTLLMIPIDVQLLNPRKAKRHNYCLFLVRSIFSKPHLLRRNELCPRAPIGFCFDSWFSCLSCAAGCARAIPATEPVVCGRVRASAPGRTRKPRNRRRKRTGLHYDFWPGARASGYWSIVWSKILYYLRLAWPRKNKK